MRSIEAVLLVAASSRPWATENRLASWFAERLGADRHGVRIQQELGDQIGLGAPGLGRARRHDDEQWETVEPAGEVPEPPQRGGVDPVQVVDRQQRGLV